MLCRCFTFSTLFQQLWPGSQRIFGTIPKPPSGNSLTPVVFTHGAHSLKIGADIRFYQLNTVAPPNPTGSFAFTTTGTNTQTATATTTTGGIHSPASFLARWIPFSAIDLQTSQAVVRDSTIPGILVQDDWHALPGLTLNIGARWTLHSPSTEKNNQGAVFNLATQVLDYVGVNGNSRSARTLHYDNVAPRFGLTYLITPKTVIRSGFGIVFIDQSGITTPFTVPQFPFIQNVQQATTDSITSPFVLSNGPTVQSIALTPSTAKVLRASRFTPANGQQRGFRLRRTQWNLGLCQRGSITNNLSFDVAYVGSHIVHSPSASPIRTSTSSRSSSSRQVARRCKPRFPTPTPVSFPELLALRPSATRNS